MQDRDLEDLALDLKELLFLLKEARAREEFIPVVKRHINRLIKSLEEVKSNLNTPKDQISAGNERVATAIMEEEFIVCKTIEQQTTFFEGKEQEEEKETPNITTLTATILGERLRPATELSKGLTLNDTFRFSRELFNGDKDAMNRTLQEISKMNTLADVVSYLSSQIEWDEENDAVKDFTELLKIYFV